MNKLKQFFAVAVAVMTLAFSLVTAAGAADGKDSQVKFNKDGKFKILILSDVQDTDKPQKETTDLMNAAIDRAKPDFIVLLGDNTAGWWKGVDKERTKAAVDHVAKAIDERKIPFALVFGNHDHEGLCDENNKMSEEDAKKLIMSWFNECEYCVAKAGEEMTGVGTYNVPIKGSDGKKTVFNLWLMDSNPYTPDEEGGGYGYVHEDQTAWYVKTSNELKKENGGKPVPSLVFQHIAVPEVYDMFSEVKFGTKGAVRGHRSRSDRFYAANPEYIYEGGLNEGPCPPDVNHGQFDSWLRQGDVIGAFFGHDHNNDFAGKYKGIKLVAVPGVTYYSYGNHHGVRTITLDENDLSDFESEIMLFSDLVPYKVKNIYKANHGYWEYKSVFLPAFFGSAAGIAALAVGITLIVKAVKKKKSK